MRASTRHKILALAVLVGTVALLALGAERGWFGTADNACMLALAGGPAGLWRAITALGDSAVRVTLAAIACLLLLAWRRSGDAVFLAAAVGGGIALNAAAKALVGRTRPALLPHGDDVGVLSFPSGHASGAMVLGLSLALLAPRDRRGPAFAAALAYAALVGCSRIALAVHWPSDVLAGWCVGAAWVLLLSRASLSGTSPPGRGNRAG